MRQVLVAATMLFAAPMLWAEPQEVEPEEVARDVQRERNAELDFLVGEWATEHRVPGRGAEPTIVPGEASIQRVVGGTFVRIDWTGRMEGRGEVSTMLMLNYSPAKEMFNCTLFDPSGGEPGIFHGDWTDENTLVLKASFTEEDGSVSHQRFTFAKVDDDTFTLARAFSDDGEQYHFEVTGRYARKVASGDPGGASTP